MKGNGNDKEFDVIVQRGNKQVKMPIIAKNEETAKALAQRLLRRRGGKATIVGATEKK
jgi:hypothetical protein